MTDAKALEYLASFGSKPKKNLAEQFPGATEEALDFLAKTLTFNPYFRISLDECFEHPLFTKVRKAEKEKIVGQPVTLDFEKMDLDAESLRKLFLEEISTYQTNS